MKNKIKSTLAGLLTAGMLMSPLQDVGSNFSSLSNAEKSNERKGIKAHEISLKLSKDNYLEKYRNDLEYSTKFWKKNFTTSSSKGFIVNPYNLNHWSKDRSEIQGRRFKDYWVFYGKKEYMKSSVQRAYKHLDYIIDSLEKHDLPISLAVVPLFESGFKEDAVSHAGAVGMWQFMEETARHYGLEVNGKKDERLDPKKSTSAFIKYYKDSQEQFNNHLFSLISYNVGRLPIFKTQWAQENPKKAIWSGIGFDPRNYAPMYFASKEILSNPEKYYGDIFDKIFLEKLEPKKQVLGYDKLENVCPADETKIKDKYTKGFIKNPN